MNALVRSTLALAACAALAAPALAQKSHQFDVDAAITIPATGTSGVASPYPSSVTVAGLTAPTGAVKVVLRGLSHTFLTDLDVLLVGPGGQSVVLLNRVGGGGPGVSGTTFVITQDGLVFPDDTIPVGPRYGPSRRTNGPITATFAAPAPAGPYGTSLDVFKGKSANGTWSLYISDQAGSDIGTLAGWSLIISEAASYTNARPITIPAGAPGTTSGPASPYPTTAIVDGVNGKIRSVSVMVSGLSHTYQGDIRLVLQAPTGQTVILYGNCGDLTDWVNADLVFDDNAAAGIPLTFTPMAAGTYKPTQCSRFSLYAANLVAPAPAGPYGTTLASLNGLTPNGAWRLWVEDSAGGDVGSIARGWAVVVNGQVCPADFNASGTLDVNDIFDFLNAWFASCP